MTIDEKRIRIHQIIDKMPVPELVNAWNDRCHAEDYEDEHIYRMSEFDDLVKDLKPSEIVGCLSSQFDITDDYFQDDCMSGSVSCAESDVRAEFIDDAVLINYIIENDDDVSNTGIRAILNEQETAEEDEPKAERAEEPYLALIVNRDKLSRYMLQMGCTISNPIEQGIEPMTATGLMDLSRTIVNNCPFSEIKLIAEICGCDVFDTDRLAGYVANEVIESSCRTVFEF